MYLVILISSFFVQIVKAEHLSHFSYGAQWKASQVTDHWVRRKSGCMAHLKSWQSPARLEVYYESLGTGSEANVGYSQPTVQVLAKTRAPRATGQFWIGGKRFEMLAAGQRGDRQLFVVRYDQRSLLRSLLQNSTSGTSTRWSLRKALFRFADSGRVARFRWREGGDVIAQADKHCGSLEVLKPDSET